ncbi:MAG: HEPN domain-containing protein [Theionarchaea archaeon]|nr:HEPN domain-containing protein [Theionarchaea archaeon]
MDFSTKFKELIDYCRNLDKHYLPTRYPNAIPGGVPYEVYTEYDSKESIRQAESIVRTVEILLEEGNVI